MWGLSGPGKPRGVHAVVVVCRQGGEKEGRTVNWNFPQEVIAMDGHGQAV